jgi:NADH:ubiquinone oxidoreductase subunit C
MSRSTELWPGRVRAAFADAFGEAASVDEGFGPISVDVPADRWVEAVALARDGLDCTFFDWLSAVDELTDGFRVVCHLADHRRGGVEHLVVRTLVPRDAPSLPTLTGVFAGARWHERETHEMFGIDFTAEGTPLDLERLLLPEQFEGHPLRKDFVLASRVAKPWPGAKEPGESDHDAVPARRKARPPGAPEPEQWGPREPGSPAPDPLAPAVSGPAARPRRAPRAARASGAEGASGEGPADAPKTPEDGPDA